MGRAPGAAGRRPRAPRRGGAPVALDAERQTLDAERETFDAERDARRQAAREAERLRLAQDLHDGPLQDLHAVRMSVAAGARPDDVEADLLGVARAIRGVVENLRPPALAAYGLRGGLESLADTFARRNPEITVTADLAPDSLAAPVQLAVYRVAQEALTNVAQHAGAGAVQIAYREADGRYTLEVRDDGAGFDPDAVPLEDRYGLAGAEERADALGAVLAVESCPGAGAVVTMSGPAGPGVARRLRGPRVLRFNPPIR